MALFFTAPYFTSAHLQRASASPAATLLSPLFSDRAFLINDRLIAGGSSQSRYGAKSFFAGLSSNRKCLMWKNLSTRFVTSFQLPRAIVLPEPSRSPHVHSVPSLASSSVLPSPV